MFVFVFVNQFDFSERCSSKRCKCSWKGDDDRILADEMGASCKHRLRISRSKQSPLDSGIEDKYISKFKAFIRQHSLVCFLIFCSFVGKNDVISFSTAGVSITLFAIVNFPACIKSILNASVVIPTFFPALTVASLGVQRSKFLNS